MRIDGNDPIDPDRGAPPEAVELPIDAAVSAWDPWLWALYLRELESEQRPALH